MPQAGQELERHATKLLYRILLAGLTVIGAVFILLVLKLLGPQLAQGPTTDIVAFSLAGVGLISVTFAVLFARPKVPERRSGQGINDYWTPETRGPALLLWIMLEGGGTIAAAGYLVTGHVVPLAIYCVALLAMVWYGPGRLAGE